MSYNRQSDYEVNEEQLTSFLLDAVKHVEEAGESEIQALNQIKKLFKKNVGMTRRNYVAAYLVKLANSGYRPRFNRDRNEGRSDRSERGHDSRRNERFNRDHSDSRSERLERRDDSRGEDHPERAPRVQIDPAAAGTIFVSIGRNRHVFPRDLVGLLISVAGLERERIGLIRVLANYSFVQLYKEDADKAIKALDGYDYRGRKLNVNISKQKDGEEPSSEEASAEVSPAAEKEVSEPQSQTFSSPVESEEALPEGVSNEGHSIQSEESAAAEKIVAEQAAFADSQAQYAETTDDGQVKSHFGNGAAY